MLKTYIRSDLLETNQNFEAKFLLLWTIGKLDETWHGLLKSYLEFHWTCWYNVSSIR